MINISNTNHWLQKQKEKFGEKTALTFNDTSITYSDFLKRSHRIAEVLETKGIAPGDNIGILISHAPEFVETINALWLIGAVPVLLNSRSSIEDIEKQLAFVSARSLIADASSLQKLPQLKFINVIKLDTINELAYTENKINLYLFNSLNSALILFTSGSAGKPKAVVHTFESLYQSVLLTDSFSQLSSEDKWLVSLPLYHIGGFMIFVRSLLTGSTLIFPDSVDYRSIANAMIKYNPTHLSLVTTTLKQLLEDNVKPNTELGTVFLGGGPIDTKLCSEAVYKGFPITKVYGSTETCSMVAALSMEDFKNKPDSAGKPLGNSKIIISDETRNYISSNRSGEIVVSCKSIFKEYHASLEETQNKKRDGYFFTGDFGWIDEDGYLYIESRREDIIITGGENVSAKEVVQYLIQLPSVNDAYVFSEGDETWGQIICAAVVLSSTITKNELREQLRNMIAPYKVPKKIYFVERIPRNEMGKVEKEKLEKLIN
jgi:O-succinylbenzoic acid--CoA ligase